MLTQDNIACTVLLGQVVFA